MSLSLVFQLSKIQCVLRLRRRSVVFSGWNYQLCWMASFLWFPHWHSYHRNIDHEFSTYSKIFCPCIDTASNANSSGPQKKLLVIHWKLGISVYCIQELIYHIKTHESTGIYHEMPPDITPIYESTPTPKSPHLCQSSWLACSKCQVPKVNHPRSRGTLLVILSLSTSMLSAHQTDCFLVVAEKHHTIRFMVAPWSMMWPLVLSGLRIKSLLELVKLWWPKNVLNNGYGNRLLL